MGHPFGAREALRIVREVKGEGILGVQLGEWRTEAEMCWWERAKDKQRPQQTPVGWPSAPSEKPAEPRPIGRGHLVTLMGKHSVFHGPLSQKRSPPDTRGSQLLLAPWIQTSCPDGAAGMRSWLGRVFYPLAKLLLSVAIAVLLNLRII